MNEEIKKFRYSKNEAERRECIQLLNDELKKNPNDAQLWYDKAGCHDFLGEELDAEPCYQKCYENGWHNLPLNQQESFFIGYGSTLRNNSKYSESIKILDEGINHFPDSGVLKIFQALTNYSLKEYQKSADILFNSIITVSEKGLQNYKTPIQWYIDNLDKKI